MLKRNFNPKECIAKSKELGGQNLEEHITDLKKVDGFFLGTNVSLYNKFNSLVFNSDGKNFNDLLTEAIEYHDDGKSHPQWQKWATANKRMRLKRHEYISGLMYKDQLTTEQLLAIICHHGNFRDDGDDGYYRSRMKEAFLKSDEKVKATYFLDVIRKINDSKSFDEKIMKDCAVNASSVNSAFIRYNALKAFLQMCDKTASFIESHPVFAKQFHKYLFKVFSVFDSSNALKKITSLRDVQKKIQNHQDRPLTILRASTGSGKTLAACLWAQKMIDAGKADKLVFTLPTKFTTNQLSKSLKSLLNIPVAGFHGDIEMNTKVENDKIDKREDKAENLYSFMMNKLMAYPVSVRTIDSVIGQLTLKKEEHYLSVTNFIGSCLVIDEIDFYDDFPMGAIHALLEKCRDWKIPVLIMSASFPESHFKFYEEIYGDDFDRTKDYIYDKTNQNVPKLKIGKIQEHFASIYGISEACKPILNKALKQDTIIYCNTTRSSFNMYEYFVKDCKIPSNQVLLYNKFFLPAHRIKQENKIMKLLGKNKEQRDYSVIVIMTQVGEISLDISAPYMISEIAPINNLYQRVGRLNRFSKEVGTLDILVPFYSVDNKKTLFCYPYVQDWVALDNSKNKTEPNEYLVKTINYLKSKGNNKTYTYKDLDKAVDTIFSDDFSYENLKDNAKKNVAILHTCFNNNAVYFSGTHTNDIQELSEDEIFNLRGIRNVTDIFVSFEKDVYDKKFDFELDYYKGGILSVRQAIAGNKIFETKTVKYIKGYKLFNQSESEEPFEQEHLYHTCQVRVLKNKKLYNSRTGLNHALYSREIQSKYSKK